MHALRDLDLTVGVGERVALLGSSGAGKSTLLDVVAGLVTPTRGEVEVLGERIAHLASRRLRRHRSRVAIVRQQHGLPPALRVLHNVNGGRLGSWSTPKALLSLVRPQGRDDVDRSLVAVGLDGLGDRRTGDLSGGQQQRVAVARALIEHPELVLADEPVSAVDPKLSTDVLSLVCDPAVVGRTTIVSLHEPALARDHADRVIGLRHGQVIFDLEPAEVSDARLDDLYRLGD
ncbi:MAG: phosphonate ABC transporter ATP-binding protein [Ilumatobacter sp.]